MHKIISMSIGIFFVNQIPFLITLGRIICFTTVTHLANRKLTSIFKAFKGIYVYYMQRGFQITTVGDGEFKSMQELMNELPGAPLLNLSSATKHEPFIKRKIRVVNENTRCICHLLPFASLPPQLVTYVVFYAVKLLNYFSVKGGVSNHYSQKAIMSEEQIHYKYYSMPFGTYCQVYEEDSP
jgi:hypothetical protein